MAKAPRALGWTMATVPLVITFKDSFFWIMSVKGSSMEPTFQSGDLLLVRKADFPLWRRWVSKEVDDGFWKEDPSDTSVPSLRDRRIRDYEFQQSLVQNNRAIYQSPPTAMRGQIVSYWSPYKYPPEKCVKRVVAVAGQVVSVTYYLLNFIGYSSIVLWKKSKTSFSDAFLFVGGNGARVERCRHETTVGRRG